MTDKTAQSDGDAEGGCLCGAVRFAVPKPLPSVSVCHCDMCRRWNSAPMLAVHPDGEVALLSSETLTWFRSSDWAERGFCSKCGTSLFWRFSEEGGETVVAAGALDDQASLKGPGQHIFVDQKPTYYEFADDAPRLTGAEAIAMFTEEKD